MTPNKKKLENVSKWQTFIGVLLLICFLGIMGHGLMSQQQYVFEPTQLELDLGSSGCPLQEDKTAII